MTTPRRNQVDLHTHTARSDGVLGPRELYEQMRAWGSTLVAITDHDTLAGVRELLAEGLGGDRGAGPRIVVGVEINTSPDDVAAALAGGAEALGEQHELHVLGLGVDATDGSLETLLEEQRAGRRARLDSTLRRLDELGLPVRDHLPQVRGGIDALGRPHVARALVAAGHADSVNDAFRRYLDPGGPAYVRRRGMGTRKAIEAIRAAGGIAALAHAPWAVAGAEIIDLLVDWGLGGLEAYYPGWDGLLVEQMAGVADERSLLATGGSDYHGDSGDYATAQAPIWVPPAIAERLLEALGSA